MRMQPCIGSAAALLSRVDVVTLLGRFAERPYPSPFWRSGLRLLAGLVIRSHFFPSGNTLLPDLPISFISICITCIIYKITGYTIIHCHLFHTAYICTCRFRVRGRAALFQKAPHAPPHAPPHTWPHAPPHAPTCIPCLSLDDSPPGSVKALKRQIRGLKAAQAEPGQEPSARAARAQQIDGLECDLEDRERKFRKHGKW